MAELRVEKPSAPPTRSREELMARLIKNPNVNPQTGAPAPKESFLDVANQRVGALIDPIDRSRSPNPKVTVDEITGANFNAGIPPVGNALKYSPVVDNPRASTPIGNITGLDNSVSTNTPPMLGRGSVSSTSQRTPTEQKVADIYGFGSPPAAPKSIPVAEPVDTDRAAMLFAKTHGSAFDPKSSADKKKMAAITNLMGQEGSEALTPNQFALKIYRTTKK